MTPETRQMPAHFSSENSLLIGAPLVQVYGEMRSLSLDQVRLAKPFIAARGLVTRLTHGEVNPDMPSFDHPLHEERPHRFVMGVVGQWWRLGGSPNRTDITTLEDFASFAEPGWAKAAFDFNFFESGDGRTFAVTRTTVTCTDETSRRAMARYWRVIKPFGSLIRIFMLHQLKDRCERPN